MDVERLVEQLQGKVVVHDGAQAGSQAVPNSVFLLVRGVGGVVGGEKGGWWWWWRRWGWWRRGGRRW